MTRLRRFFAVLKAAWRLLRSPQTDSTPEVTEPQGEGFDFENDSYLASLVTDERFMGMLETLCEDNVGRLTSYLRSCIREQRNVEAAQTEAALTVFEDLKSVFLNYAARYRVTRERAA